MVRGLSLVLTVCIPDPPVDGSPGPTVRSLDEAGRGGEGGNGGAGCGEDVWPEIRRQLCEFLGFGFYSFRPNY